MERLDPFGDIAANVVETLERLFFLHRPVFLFLVGIPGSGKTTFASRYLNSYPTVSYDRMVVHLLRERADTEIYVDHSNVAIVDRIEQELRKLLVADTPVVVFEEATLGLSCFRGHFLHLARLHGYHTVILYFPIDLVTAEHRNASRSLGMTKGGQMRMPRVILDTIHTHQNTQFRISPAHVSRLEGQEPPYLMSELTLEEKAHMDSAFFRMIAITPANIPYRSFLTQEDYCDQLWTIQDRKLHVSTNDSILNPKYPKQTV